MSFAKVGYFEAQKLFCRRRASVPYSLKPAGRSKVSLCNALTRKLMATVPQVPTAFLEMFDVSHVGEVALRTALVYLGLLLAMRVAGKREVGQMKPFDLVTLLIISNAVQNAMVGQDSSLMGGLMAAVVILLLNFIVS